MAKVWFSRREDLQEPVLYEPVSHEPVSHKPVRHSKTEHSADIPTVRARPTPPPRSPARTAPPVRPNAQRPSVPEVPYWLEPESDSTVAWIPDLVSQKPIFNEPARAPARPSPRSLPPTPAWSPKPKTAASKPPAAPRRRGVGDPETALLTPIGMQDTMPRIPADWRERLASAPLESLDDIAIEPLDDLSSPSLEPFDLDTHDLRGLRPRIPHPANPSALPTLVADSSYRLAAVKPASRVGVSLMAAILINATVIAGILGAISAVAAPDVLRWIDAQRAPLQSP